MSDEIKEIAEKWRTVLMISIEGCLYNFTMFQNLDQQHRDAIVSAVSEGLYEEPIEQAIREYESSEIARLRGIIEVDVTTIRETAEAHPLFMGYGLDVKEINAEGGDASFVTDIAYKAQSILSEAGKA